MPILVEADSTTAGVLTTALPSGSHVVARPEDLDGWLSGAPRVRRGDRTDRRDAGGHRDRREGARQPPRDHVVLIRHDLAPQVFAEAMSVGIGAVVAADDSVGVLQPSAGRAPPGRRSTRPAAQAADATDA